ncbi:unnamed protein product [Clonostachys rhizophaga]|uniref:Uncharacterized protein n=1 Tax=Clonostachys rhizophaga TaxID=160324 RepID=A0A9N9V4C1_9HYPO|nr:unnamed protein product [Clonostachys rhizophaga]
MELKRKRSFSSVLSSPSSSLSNSPPHDRAMMMSMITSPLLHSRTMKRFRNSRPSEEEVHQRTLGLLYSAQQNPAMVPEPAPESTSLNSTASRQQQSLHRFWNINSRPSAQIETTAMANFSPTACEDCGAGLGASGQDDGMDIDSAGFDDDTACGACGKHVCFSCSVSNLGEQKRCLQCAGPLPTRAS